MFLKRLVLSNIRCIEQLSLSFQSEDGGLRRWTLLLGENGAGKSTILQSIALLLAGSEGLAELEDFPQSFLRSGADEGILGIDLLTDDGDEGLSVALQIRRSDNLRRFFERNARELDRLESQIETASHKYFTAGYGVCRRRSTAETAALTGLSFHTPRMSAVATLFDPDTVLNPLETWALDLHYRRGAQGLSFIKRAFDGLLMGVEFEGIDRETHQLRFRTPDGIVKLGQLSDGYQSVASWWGDLLYRITDLVGASKNPLNARGVCCIDELELHLHPIWQRQLRDFLTKKLPNFQFVATTHSPLTAQQADEGELFYLSRPEKDASPQLHQYEGIPRYLMAHQMISSDAFGLQTVDSKHVEDLRATYHKLTAKDSLSEREKKRLRRLREELAVLPDGSVESPSERRQRELLEKISRSLDPGGLND